MFDLMKNIEKKEVNCDGIFSWSSVIGAIIGIFIAPKLV